MTSAHESLPTSNNQLPGEIITSIVAYTEHEDLLSLALVSKGFHRIANSKIYRRVYYVEERNTFLTTGYGLPDGEEYLTPRVGHMRFLRASRVFRLAEFLRTVSNSEALRRLVVAACFCYHHDHASDEDPAKLKVAANHILVESILGLIGPYTKHLHVATPGGHAPGCLGGYQISSTHIDTRTLKHDGYDQAGRFSIFGRDEWYWLFQEESLKCLELSQIRSWRDPADGGHPTRDATANIESLSFLHSEQPGASLKEVLAWPKSLKYFHFSANRFGPSDWILAPLVFSEALWAQRSSLVSLTIKVFPWHTDKSVKTFSNLQEFVRLKQLAVPLEYLIPDACRNGVEYTTDMALQLAERLPLSLERLQINLVVMFRELWELNPVPYTRHMPESFNHFLCEFARQKQPRLPKLDEIIIWRYMTYGMSNTDLDSLPDCAPVMAAMKEARIKWRAVDCNELPLLMDN